MSFEQYIEEECIGIDTVPKGASKDQVLHEIAGLAKSSNRLTTISENRIYQALKEREEIGTTGFGNGIALPHCSFEDMNNFVVGALLSKEGVDFQSLDKEKVNVIFFIIGPKNKRNEHIYILSLISRVLQNPASKAELLSKTSPREIKETFLSFASPLDINEEPKEKVLFHVFVQNEKYFDAALEILSSASLGNLTVLESSNAGYYFHSLPLFSALWSEDHRTFSRLVLAVIEKENSNDTVRRIHTLLESGEKYPGIMITVQELFYVSGSLEF